MLCVCVFVFGVLGSDHVVLVRLVALQKSSCSRHSGLLVWRREQGEKEMKERKEKKQRKGEKKGAEDSKHVGRVCVFK